LGEILICEARNISKSTLIHKTGRHRAQRIKSPVFKFPAASLLVGILFDLFLANLLYPFLSQGERHRGGHAIVAVGYEDKMKIKNLLLSVSGLISRLFYNLQ